MHFTKVGWWHHGEMKLEDGDNFASPLGEQMHSSFLVGLTCVCVCVHMNAKQSLQVPLSEAFFSDNNL